MGPSYCSNLKRACRIFAHRREARRAPRHRTYRDRVTQFLNEHVTGRASRSKLSKLLLYLRNILDHAVMKKLIPANPARNPGYRLKAKSRKAVSGRYLSMEECQRLLSVVSGADHLAFRIFIQLGLRSEE